MFPFYTPLKTREAKGVLVFSRGIKMRTLFRNELNYILKGVEVDISRFESCNTWRDIWLATTFLNLVAILNSYICVVAFAKLHLN